MFSKITSLYLNSVADLSKKVWLLAFTTFINRSGTMVIPFLSVYMTSRLGFSLEEAGYVLLFFGLGSVAGSYLGGFLSDRIGYYRVLYLSLFFGGAMFLLLGAVDTLVGVSAMVFLTAAIGDAYRPAVMTAVAVYSSPENRTRAFSLIRMSVNLGWAIGPALGGFIVATTGGYSTIFWADGFTCMAAAVFFIVFLREKKKAKTAGKPPVDVPPKLSPYKDKKYMFFIGMTIVGAVAFMQFLYTLPVFYKEKMLMDESQIGMMMALSGLLIFFIEMPLVYILERKFKVLENVAIGVFMYGAAFVMLNLATGPSIAIAAISMVLLSVGEIFNMPFTNAYSMGRANESNRGAYMGVFSMAYSVTQIIGPPIGTTAAAHWGFDGLWYLMGVLSLLSFSGILYLKKWEARAAKKTEEEIIPATAPQMGGQVCRHSIGQD